MILHRINPRGLEFDLTEVGGETLVRTTNLKINKTLTIDMPIDEVNRAWYQWQMKGEYLQVAFAALPAGQREFLLTGITPKEWDEMFKDDKGE